MNFDPMNISPHRYKLSEPSSIFVNRLDERRAFEDSIIAFRRMLYDGNYFDGKARNLLHFSGMGGIGKSALVERFNAWITAKLGHQSEWGRIPSVGVDDTAVIDFWNSNGFIEIETLILAIRNCLNRYKKSWPAFDLALLAYWSATHPLESIASHPAMKTSTYNGLKDTLKTVMGDLDIPMPGTVGTFGIDLIDKVIRESWERSRRQQAATLHPDFLPFLKECAEIPSPGLPRPDILVRATSLLAQELEQAPGSIAPVNIIFMDTFERLEQDPRREGEQLISDVIRRMPNILFVIVGRNKLKWNEMNYLTIAHRGPRIWECLNSDRREQPSAHVIGNLSMIDRRRMVDFADKKYGLGLDEKTKQLLVVKSGGLPKYIQLALSQALALKNNDLGPLTPTHIEDTFPELVKRVLEDIPEQEQRVIRAAAMFRTFDPELVAVSAGTEIATGERAMKRPMIEPANLDGRDFCMHDAVREALHKSCTPGEDGWLESDWNIAATKALRLLHERYDSAAEAENYTEALRALAAAIEVISVHHAALEPAPSASYANWLVQAVVYSPSTRGLFSMIPLDAHTNYGKNLVQYIKARAKVHLPEERISVLNKLFRTDGDLSIIAGRTLAYELRTQIRFDDAIAVFDDLVERNPSQLHLYQRCLSKAMARRFYDALQSTDGLDADRIGALKSGIHLWHGDPTVYFSRNDSARSKLQNQRRQREYLDSTASRLRWNSLFVNELDLSVPLNLLAQGRTIHHNTATRDSLVALLLRAPHDPRWPSWLRELLVLDRSSNDGRMAYRGSLIRAVAAYCTGDAKSLGVLAKEIESFDRPRSRVWIPIECILNSADIPITIPDTQWVEDPDVVADRWMKAIEALRSRFVDK